MSRRKRSTLVAAAIVIALVVVTLAGPARRPLAVAWWGWRLESTDHDVRVRAARELRAIGRPKADRYWPDVVAVTAVEAVTFEPGALLVGRKDATGRFVVERELEGRVLPGDAELIERVAPERRALIVVSLSASGTRVVDAFPIDDELDERALKLTEEWLMRL